MITRITPIKLDERSHAVANLHAALQMLGFHVDPAELNEQRAGDSTGALVRQFQQQMKLTPIEGFLIDEASAEAINRTVAQQGIALPASTESCWVRGIVQTLGGDPVRELLVVAYDQDLRKRQELGRIRTLANGEYTIYYGPELYQGAERGGPDLVLEVSAGKEEVLYASDVMFNASTALNFNIVLTGRTSEAEFDALLRVVQPLLEGQDAALDTLDENDGLRDISFLSGETGVGAARLTEFVLAHRLARDGLPPPFWFALQRSGAGGAVVPPAKGWASLADAAQALLAQALGTPPARLEGGLKSTVALNIISAKDGDAIGAWMRALRALAAKAAGSEPARSGSVGLPGAASVHQLLAAADLPKEQHQLIIDAYLESPDRQSTIAQLRKAKALEPDQLQALDTHLALHDMSFGDAALAVAVLALHKIDPRDPTALRKVAQLDAPAWEETMRQAQLEAPAFVAGDKPEQRRANYARLIALRFQSADPTAAFAAGLQRAIAETRDGETRLQRQAPAMLRFLDQNPGFTLAATGIDHYLEHGAHADNAELARDPQFVQQLKATQRIYKIAPSFEATSTLLDDGLHSAQQIYRQGKQAFVRKYADQPGFSDTIASDTWERAANTHAAAVALVGELRSIDNGNALFALDSGSGAVTTFPNLANLFGSADSCECDQCRSVFSAAAYLADVLMYLETRKAADGVTSVKNVLFARRPELGTIELTCANTNTVLPYVDLACEVLEDQLAPWKLFNLPLALAPSFAKGPVSAAVRAAFAAAVPALTLSAAARVSAPDHGGAWTVRDTTANGEATWRVRTAGATLEVALLRQTRCTPEELAANPEYVNEAAYQKLAAASYPLSLPFNLPAEEVDAYLAKVGVRRSTLMETLRGPTAPNNPADLDIAVAHLGITPAERELIFASNAAQQFQFWGEANNAAAIAALSQVTLFLGRTGLSYQQLQSLLTLDFINPNGAIAIQHPDASCDISGKRIVPLDAAALDRIHRFLRLWRKLGWEMWELDLVIRNQHIGTGTLDNACLLQLYPFIQVREQLAKLSIEQACALFDRINTRAAFGGASARPIPSLYEQLFLNKQVMDKLDPAFAIAAVTAADVPLPPAGVPNMAPDHLGAVLAATRVSDADLALLRGLILPASDKLHLGNLSFLYRHALLIKTLRIKAPDWVALLYVLQQDVFATPAALRDFLRLNERIKAAGFNIDELGYVLAARLDGKAAESDKNISANLGTLRKGLQAIAAGAAMPLPTDIDGAIGFIGAQLLALGWDNAGVTALATLFKPEVHAAAMPDSFVFPPAIAGAMPIAFNGDTRALSFRGLMTDAQRTTLLGDASLAAVTALPDYQNGINALFNAARAAMKFYWPVFRSALKTLPPDVQFGSQLAPELAAKVAYDGERQQLVFSGLMSGAELAALNGLSVDPAYLAAVLDLFNQPAGAFPPDRLWVVATDGLASAAAKLAAYSAAALARNLVIQQFSTALRTTPALSEQLLTTGLLFGVPKHRLLDDYLDSAFAGSSAAVTAAAFPALFQGARWLHRVALVLRKTKAGYAELDWLRRTAAQTGVLAFGTLPLVYDASIPAIASLSGLLDLARFMQLHHAYSTAELSLPDMIERIIGDASYGSAQFCADMATLAPWPQADLAILTGANVLTTAYPAGYRHAAAWDRLAQCFGLLLRLNAGAASALALAAPAMAAATAQQLKQLLRGKYEVEQWLAISKDVQDKLRHRKRNSLVDYLLTQPMPAGAPSAKWDNANDLYAYYLIDVEMCACMQTSRLVQATNSAQLFVQRCFMGLEPAVRVSVDHDDAWKQWTWMKNYRVWEANRRVFIYPENYALPELKRDKSEIFKKLEDELLQNDVTRDNVETAFLHYLEKLDEVAQLEIAGTYYQESIHTLHVFGRTAGSEPHTYFYRQFIDSRRWTAWSKVECDIKSDYLVPLVTNERLHLVWPEFREHPDDQGSVNVPTQGQPNKTLDKPLKSMDVFLAVTEFRSGKWTPKKVSQAPVSTGPAYQSEFDKSPYLIIPLDFTWLPDGPFLLQVYEDGAYSSARLFELAGCKGYPEPYIGNLPIIPVLTRFDRDEMVYIKNVEDVHKNGDALVPTMSFALTEKILDRTPDLFKISYPQYMSRFDKLYFLILAAFMQASGYGTTGVFARKRGIYVTLGTYYDWFYADKLRTFFVQHEVMAPNGTRFFYQDFMNYIEAFLLLLATGQTEKLYELIAWFIKGGFKFELLFNNFYHPLTCHITKQLYAKGVDGMMAREVQFKDRHLDFNAIYKPTPYVDPAYPQEVIDFTPGASYAQYNWELFYFAPLSIATRLSANQRFEEAMQWFHYIFDPTGGHDRDPLTSAVAPAPQKYWITQPFYLRLAAGYEAERIENLMNMLASNVRPGTPSPAVKQLQDHIDDWRKNPFDPHIVAQFRTVAYQKLTVMKYIDNLIAWGDQQFRQFTMESVNTATQLYVLADEILGQRPRRIPPPAKPTPETFNEIEDELDKFSNAMVELENFVPAPPSGGGGGAPVPPVPNLLYFCIPQNDQMVAYWDRVEDRLYKIRQCLDIDGVARSLSLFAPAIDPAALIRALVSGADLAGAIAGLDAPLPHYRFTPTLQKANEFINDVKALGGALLGAIEKKDAEALTRLRQQHELAVLNASRLVKQAQIQEVTHALEGLQKNREMVTIRRDYYASRPFISPGETGALALNGVSLGVHTAGAVADVLGGVLAVIPDFQIGASGFGGSPHASAKTGGMNFSKAAELAARALYQTATILDKTASITSTMAGYQRRMDDWQNQLTLARKELEQMDRQIAAAQIRIDNAQRELANHDLQIENSKSMDAFFHDKYTNQELYDWMITQVSQTYFQSYQLAFDMGRRAERCFQYELGVDSSSYVQFGYWDSLKSGLQAGERLQLSLRQLESAYLDGNRREFECTKHVSLALINPLALIRLKDSGMCMVDIPEELFDLDYPGHYFRRIKSVSLSLPCVAGPHTTVNCTLRLIKNMVRTKSSPSAPYEHNNDNGVFTDDVRFRESHVRANAIATSNGQNDNGMFELNFRDERYLPFEGAGAISTWQIELVADRSLRQFDYDTISDVVLHLRYSAREDGGLFKTDTIAHLQDVLQNASSGLRLRRMFDLRREFGTEWYAFLHPGAGGHKEMTIQLTRAHFAALGMDAGIQVESISFAAQTSSNDEMKVQLHPPLGALAADQLTFAAAAHAGDFRSVGKKNIGDLLDLDTPWTLRIRKSALGFDDLEVDQVQELFMVVEYTLQP